MWNQKICCNPFKLRNHLWIGKGVAKAPSSFEEKFSELRKYVCISCRFHISNNTIPSNKLSVSVNDNNNTPFEEDPSSPDLPGSDKEYVKRDMGLEIMISGLEKYLKAHNCSNKICMVNCNPAELDYDT